MLTSVDRLLFIRNVPIFKELRDDFLVRLASVMDEIYFDTDYTIITEGQEGHAMYIVVSGQVSVHLGEQTVAQLKSNDCFGEMSVFDAEPRSASVTTLEPCECLVLTQQQLYDAIDETPGIAVNIIRLLSRRIRELNQELNSKKQQLGRMEAWPKPTTPVLTIPAQAEPVAAPQPHLAEELEVPTWDNPFPYGPFPYGNVTY